MTLAPVSEVVEEVFRATSSAATEQALPEDDALEQHLLAPLARSSTSIQFEDTSLHMWPSPGRTLHFFHREAHSKETAPSPIMPLKRETACSRRALPSWLRIGAIRAVLCGIDFAVAVLDQIFDRMLSLSVGSLLSFTVSIAFPPLAYVKLQKAPCCPKSQIQHWE
jgi:hypothetical protein